MVAATPPGSRIAFRLKNSRCPSEWMGPLGAPSRKEARRMASQPRRHNSKPANQVKGPVAHFVRCPTLNESDIQVCAQQLFQLAEQPGPQDLYLDFGAVD